MGTPMLVTNIQYNERNGGINVRLEDIKKSTPKTRGKIVITEKMNRAFYINDNCMSP